MSEPSGPGDLYSRADYRRMVAWGKRIERERPFLERLLEAAPDRSVVDLGCGTGEHVAFFATIADRAVGIDASPSMIEAARDHEDRGAARFLLGDARDAPRLLDGERGYGLVVCLGNVLPHLREEDELDAFLGAAHEVLAPGGMFLVQILNYARILDLGERHLPLSFRDGDDGKEIVFLRLMTPEDEDRVLFFPTTLEVDPAAEEPVRVVRTKRVSLRPWRATELSTRLRHIGFDVRLHGDMQGGPYEPAVSTDLVLVATRSP